jgi:hypothetical protein
VISIRKCCRERIVEHRGGLSEVDAVLLEIGRGLGGTPRKNREASIASPDGDRSTAKKHRRPAWPEPSLAKTNTQRIGVSSARDRCAGSERREGRAERIQSVYRVACRSIWIDLDEAGPAETVQNRVARAQLLVLGHRRLPARYGRIWPSPAGPGSAPTRSSRPSAAEERLRPRGPQSAVSVLVYAGSLQPLAAHEAVKPGERGRGGLVMSVRSP